MFLQRSTGRFSCGVSASLGRAGGTGRRAKCFGDWEAWSLWACAGFISTAMQPPARVRRLTCTCVELRLSCVSEPGRSSCWPGRRDVGLPFYLLRLPWLSIHHALLSFLLRPRKGKWQSKDNTISLLLVSTHCFRAAGRERHPGSTLDLGCSSVFHPRKLY